MSTPSAYDPSTREPETFGELATFAAHWAAFPRSGAGAAPVVAKNPNYEFLEAYCTATFGSMGLQSLARLRAQYALRTEKTAEQIDATTLQEIADHFRHLSRAGQEQTQVKPAARPSTKRPKRSGEPSGSQIKLIAALTKHHRVR